MKKSNKGFTLVELLGAIIILGILAVLAIPQLTSMLNNSKDKMYISDAIKFLSLAEKTVRSDDSIELPDEGKYIVISLSYLDDGSFDTAPNGGKYHPYRSFVLIKNNDGNMEYTVTLVEKLKKGGYKGIEKATSNSLYGTGSNKAKVKGFSNDDDIITKIKDTCSNDDECGYKDYISLDITSVYLNKSSSSPVEGEDVILKVTNLKVTGASATDKKIAKVTLGIKYNGESNINITIFRINGRKRVFSGNVNKDEYGDGKLFSRLVTLTDLNDSVSSDRLEVQVTAGDKSVTKTITYYLYKDSEAPEITTATIRSTSGVKLRDTIIHFEAVDNFDGPNNIKVCISNNRDSCSEYRAYSEMFDNNHEARYCIPCPLDGKECPLYVFVRDSINNQNIKNIVDPDTGSNYKPVKNDIPNVENVSITSINKKYNGLDVKVQIRWTDDYDKVHDGKSDIMIFMNNILYNASQTGNSCGGNNVDYGSVIDCTNTSSGRRYTTTCNYTFSGNYDGVPRQLKLRILDSFSGSWPDESDPSKEKTYTYTPYKNKGPVIESANIVSAQSMCDGCSGGSLSTYVDLVASDDLDNAKDLSVCILENDNVGNCNFINYKSNFVNKTYTYTFTPNNLDKPYDGSTKKLYIYVKDSYGVVSKFEKNYSLFNDSAPDVVANAYKFDDNIKLSVSVKDFLDQYSICIGSNNSTCDNYSEWYDGNILNSYNYTLDLTDEPLYVFVKDRYDNVVVKPVTPEESYTECTLGRDYTYEYTRVSGIISPTKCSGMCTATAPISATYTKITNYFDQILENKSCSKTKDLTVHCDFHLCFKFDNGYSNFVIGTKVNEGSISMTIGDTTYESGHYYRVYISRYDETTGNIVLTPTSTRVPAMYNERTKKYELIDYYAFDANKNNYVRISD